MLSVVDDHKIKLCEKSREIATKTVEQLTEVRSVYQHYVHPLGISKRGLFTSFMFTLWVSVNKVCLPAPMFTFWVSVNEVCLPALCSPCGYQ